MTKKGAAGEHTSFWHRSHLKDRMDHDTPQTRTEKKGKKKDSHGPYSTKHIRAAEALREKKAKGKGK